ncbi:MAG TPA: GTPase Era [Longimicrobiaceae bacterium]|nr:GTPase Era [Longimicrobiaceae bacterium]
MSESIESIPEESHPTRAGLVTLVGLPNVGKSSLLNRLIDQKLSIVTPFAQTTRERVVGIDSRDGAQMIFVDTPGIVDPAYLLHHSMLGLIRDALSDTDVVVLLLDGRDPPPELGEEMLSLLNRSGSRLVVAINKIDIATTAAVARLRSWAHNQLEVPAISISAATGAGVDELRARIIAGLPASPFLYPDDELSTQSVRFFVSELIRETVFEQYQEEIPYSVAVRVDEFREAEDPLFIRATIYVERASQKGILIGRRGAAIRELGTASRRKIEIFVGRRIYLDLWIKILPNWRKKSIELQRLGFPVPPEKA